jgi:hypothetical protein
MNKAVWGARVLLSLALAGAVALSSCSETVRTGQSSSYLVLNSLQGGSGEAGTLGAVLQSDVQGDNGIFTDRGQATFQLVMKDEGGLAPSAANAITITQYRVEYVRSDGRNTPGVDVPYPFDGAVTLTVANGGSVGFTLVRIQAKLEAPLRSLAFHGGALAITTIARVTFYGREQTGREVSVTGNIEVTFADWAG